MRQHVVNSEEEKMTQKIIEELFTSVVLEVFKLDGMLSAEGDGLSKEFRLTSSRWKILGAISMSEGLLTVPQIAREMGQGRQAVQRLVDVMSKDGLLYATDNPNHKRARYIQMTAKAEKIYANLSGKQIDWAARSSADLTESGLETALTLLRKMTNRFGA